MVNKMNVYLVQMHLCNDGLDSESQRVFSNQQQAELYAESLRAGELYDVGYDYVEVLEMKVN